MNFSHALAAASLAGSMLTACPKDPPPDEPVPAGCKPPNHCADQEGPPPIGTNPPAPK